MQVAARTGVQIEWDDKITATVWEGGFGEIKKYELKCRLLATPGNATYLLGCMYEWKHTNRQDQLPEFFIEIIFTQRVHVLGSCNRSMPREQRRLVA